MTFRVLLLVLALFLAASFAQAGTLYLNPSGDDASDCLSPATACRSLQRAVDLTPFGNPGTDILLADGVYTTTANVYYHKVVSIKGNCAMPAAVTVLVPSGEMGFRAQDHAIMIVRCLTLEAMGVGAIGIASRQYAIVDYSTIRFGAFPGGLHLAADEGSRINCGGEIEIVGDAVVHAAAGFQSFVSLACSMRIPEPRSIDYFVTVGTLSLVNARSVAITEAGDVGTTGMQYIIDGGVLLLNGGTLPGSGHVVVNGGHVN